MGYGALRAAIAAWQVEQAATRVEYGGRTTFANSANLAGNAGTGFTFVGHYINESIRQDGYIRSIDYGANKIVNLWKFKLFRPDGSGGYTLVDETETFNPPGTGNQTFVPAQPLGPCQEGDRVGVWLSDTNAAIYVSSDASSAVAYKSGDLDTVTSPTVLNGFSLNLRFNGIPPFAVGVGDSQMAGRHSASYHLTFKETGGPSGNPLAEPLNQVRALVPTLEYQNFAKTGETWFFTASNIAAINALQSKVVIGGAGVNGIASGQSPETSESYMDTVKAGLTHGQKLFVNEIFPWTAGNDTQAATIREWNARLAIWCAANDAVLVSCHDQMAMIRASTGELDDLATAYDYGGLHPTVPAGVDRFALLMTQALNAYAWG